MLFSLRLPKKKIFSFSFFFSLFLCASFLCYSCSLLLSLLRCIRYTSSGSPSLAISFPMHALLLPLYVIPSINETTFILSPHHHPFRAPVMTFPCHPFLIHPCMFCLHPLMCPRFRSPSLAFISCPQVLPCTPLRLYFSTLQTCGPNRFLKDFLH